MTVDDFLGGGFMDDVGSDDDSADEVFIFYLVTRFLYRITGSHPQAIPSDDEQPSENEEDDESDFPDDQSFASVDDLDGMCPSNLPCNVSYVRYEQTQAKHI
jgi:hypothetical protein